MSQQQQIVHTLCFQTRDARSREEGRFVFDMPGSAPRLNGVKVALGSLEFPMVQWTIENEWNLVYFNEGVRLRPQNRTLHLKIDSLASNERHDVKVLLPLRINNILKWTVDTSLKVLRVTCQMPHGLWCNDNDQENIKAIWWANASILASPLGTLNLKVEQVVPLNATEFAIPLDDARAESVVVGVNNTYPRAGYVYVPDPPSPQALCDLLNAACRAVHARVHASWEYNARTNQCTPTFTSDEGTYRVTVVHTELSTLLGVGGFDRIETVAAGRTVRMITEQCRAWTPATLTPGHYGPCHRSMCTTAPSKLTSEFELAFNRLFFPLSERVPQGSMTSHFLVFVDPSGETHLAPVPCGRYSTETFCALLETSMTALAATNVSGVSFSVSYESERFAFACEVRDEYSRVIPATFSLVLNHPSQFDPERIGFAPLMYAGRASYASTSACPVANVSVAHDPTSSPMCPFNVYRLVEVPRQQRFKMFTMPMYNITGVITAYNPATAALSVKTYVGQLPFSHGLVEGDVVQIVTASPGEIFVPSDDEGWVGKQIYPCPLSRSWNRHVQVVRGETAPEGEAFKTTHLTLRVRPTNDLLECVGQSICIMTEPRPFNVCVGTLNRSVPRHVLGVDRGATQWGVDGTLLNDDLTLRLPPFDFPYVHNLDHPDYVLVYLDEGKRGTLLQHRIGASTTTPLAKIVLYPLFREERMLPRDTTMISGENLSSFTITFRNSDGSPYHFHGAEFSLSLNIVQVSD